MNIGNLELVSNATLALIIGVIAGILGVVLYSSGLGGFLGIGLALVFSLILVGLQWWFGPVLIKWMSGAAELPAAKAPKIHAMVDALAKKAGIPKPKLWVVQNATPNAFAFGRSQKDSNIALHTGLVERLSEEELKAVLGHEMGHIKHRDVLVMTIASVIPILLYYVAILFLGGNRDDNRPTIGIFLGGLLARFVGQLLVMWLSRVREYHADQFSANLTNPKHLMAALAKISYQVGGTNSSLSSLYIGENTGESAAALARYADLPAKDLAQAIEKEQKMGFFEVFMTHPLTAKRLLALKEFSEAK